jgi:hypothetical protein
LPATGKEKEETSQDGEGGRENQRVPERQEAKQTAGEDKASIKDHYLAD